MSSVNDTNPISSRKSVGRNTPIFIFLIVTNAVLCLLPVIFFGRDSEIRYAKYLMPVLAFLVAFVIGIPMSAMRERVAKHFSSYLKLYMIMLAFSLLNILLFDEIYIRFFEEAFFIVAPLISAFLTLIYYDIGRKQVYARVLLVLFCAGFVFEVGPHAVFNLIKDPESLLSGLSTSQLSTESELAFVFGLFALHFVFSKDKLFAVLAIALSVISFKRIVMAGVIGSIGAYLIFYLMQRAGRLRYGYVVTTAIMINIAALALTYAIAYGQIDELISSAFGVSTNYLTMGRMTLYYNILSIGEVPIGGLGLGKCYELLSGANLHSDILKIFVEFGPILFFAWILIFYRVNARSIGSLAMAIYMNILFMTDNTIIYYSTMYFFYFFSGLQLVHENMQITSPQTRTLNDTGDILSPSSVPGQVPEIGTVSLQEDVTGR